ncbi:MAG: malate dehydrogenase [Lentisphaerae bacterium]|nr:malate dehydrogenase [Lentisphaerota bacterium]
MSISRERILEYHRGGKIGLRLAKELSKVEDLCIAYTPGVAVPVREIARDPAAVHRYTAKDNLVAVVTDGTAVLGLGDVGAAASIPVMEGKAVLFKAFGDVDAWPVPLNRCREGGGDTGRTDPQRVVDVVCALAPMYGGINLEDIAAPACFEIEDRLDEMLDIPVFHDDQWGTAVITLAGVMNYALLSGREIPDLKFVINGAGAAGIRIAEMLKAAGAEDVTLCDSKGVVRQDRAGLSGKKREHAVKSRAQTVGEAMKGAHVFIGVSVADCISPDDVFAMAGYPAILAMANPDPEILPENVAAIMGDKPFVMATGRSDYPNQINNVLGFPFLFRGALDAGASSIDMPMKIAASEALARVAREPVDPYVLDLFNGAELSFGPDYLIPKPFDRRLFEEVPCAVFGAAVESGAAVQADIVAYREALAGRNARRLLV